jgi:hypothetical protein
MGFQTVQLLVGIEREANQGVWDVAIPPMMVAIELLLN